MDEKRKAIQPIEIEKEMKTSFISYAMAVRCPMCATV